MDIMALIAILLGVLREQEQKLPAVVKDEAKDAEPKAKKAKEEKPKKEKKSKKDKQEEALVAEVPIADEVMEETPQVTADGLV